MPWHGYSLGVWHQIWDDAAQRAASGDYLENGKISLELSQKEFKPESKINPETGLPENN